MKDVKIIKVDNEREEQRLNASVKNRKKRKRNKFLTNILILFFVFIVGFVLSVTVFFNIEKVTVTEGGQYTYDEIIKNGQVKTGDNLFRVNSKNIADRIENGLVNVDEAKVTKKFPNSLNIEIIEVIPTFTFPYKNEFAIVSQKGKILEITEQNQFNLCQIIGIDINSYNVKDYVYNKDKEFDLIIKIFECLNKQNFEISSINKIDISDKNSISILFENRIEIKIGNQKDLDYKLKFSKHLLDEKILKQEKGVINATNPSKSVSFDPSYD